MTRDEAIKKVQHVINTTGASAQAGTEMVDALVALDLLKVEAPPTVDEQAHAVLQKIMTEVANGGVLTGRSLTGVLTSYGAGCIRSGLDTAGLTIVRKEDVK